MNKIEEEMIYSEFKYIGPIKVMESAYGVALISGTLLVEGISRNKNVYEIDEMENIAKQAEGVPMYFGVKEDINPNTGVLTKNLHDDSDDHRIGKIIKTAIDRINKKITFIAEVANTPLFPDLVDRIKSGWGVSIGGFVSKLNPVVDKIKGLCNKIKNMVVEHVSLIEPSVVRGQDSAQVEDVKIQESMIYNDESLPTLRLKINIGRGCSFQGVK
ncbi:MAG: hypothetical protein ABSA76_15500 [Bacteroidales bacterium]|jgi:hypothetical protein